MLTKTEDNSYTLYSSRYEQTYHSSFGAVAESLHVFLNGSGAFERLQQKQATRILEIGFGLGLNCLLTADCAATYKAPLDYTSIEHQLIDRNTFDELRYRELLTHPTLADRLAPVFDAPGLNHSYSDNAVSARTVLDKPNVNKEHVPSPIVQNLNEHISLSLVLGNAVDIELAKLCSNSSRKDALYDVIYMDAFSPEHNPECWTRSFFEQLANVLAPSGKLATYCVKGSVRRNLAAAGFEVHKYPGPTGKREVLWAELS